MRTAAVTLLTLFLLIAASKMGEGAPSEEQKVMVFTIGYNDADDLISSVRSLVSREGMASVSASSNAIIVRDYPANLAAIKKLLAQLDKKPATIRVEVKFVEETQAREVTAKLGFKVTRNGWRIATLPAPGPAGGNSGVIDFRASFEQMKSQRRQTLTLTENRPGSIFVGEERPFERVERHATPFGETVTRSVEHRQAGQSLEVTARLTGDGKIAVDLRPESSAFRKSDGATDIQRAATTVIVDNPGSMVIGGVTQSGSGGSISAPTSGNARRSSGSSLIILTVFSKPEKGQPEKGNFDRW